MTAAVHDATLPGRHLSSERLSAYLDHELSAAELVRVEDHLEACPSCRAHLDSLSRVVHRLQGLERAAPPPLLAEQVARRVALEGRPKSLLERLERRLSGQPIHNQVFHLFALVLTLAMVLYIFAQGQELIERRRIPVRVASPEASAEFTRQHEIAIGLRSEVADRVFTRQGEGWREQGVTGEPEASLAASSPEGLEILDRHPELAVMLGSGGTVVLRDGERVVEVRPE